jgi:signal recognition particle subunit SRP54
MQVGFELELELELRSVGVEVVAAARDAHPSRETGARRSRQLAAGGSRRRRARRPRVPFRLVFDTLANRLQDALGDVGRRSRLDEETVQKATREIRLALLEADVDFGVVKELVAGIRERALDAEVLTGLKPGQQVVKIVHEELTELMGAGESKLAFGRPPTVILMAGLQGSGKTTTSAKLALHLRKHEQKTPGLVPADLQRPAAIDQLEQLGRQIQVPVYRTDTSDPVEAARAGLERAAADGCDVVIVDTAGRLQIDEALMDELLRVRDAVKPLNVLLVLDAMTGQAAVEVARAFQERVAFDGIVLTKLDGDARGGAALSAKAITGRPVKFASVGEKLDQLEVFHPDRMASRILGMGDVLTLIEKAEQAIEQDEQDELERRMRAGTFTFDDFLTSSRMLKKMGPLQGVMKMIPGMGRELEGIDVDERHMARVEAIVLSMTPHERRTPHVINGPRRRRIAAGSGTSIEEVNRLLQARKQMEKMMRQLGKGKLPTLPPAMTGGAPRKGRR